MRAKHNHPRINLIQTKNTQHIPPLPSPLVDQPGAKPSTLLMQLIQRQRPRLRLGVQKNRPVPREVMLLWAGGLEEKAWDVDLGDIDGGIGRVDDHFEDCWRRKRRVRLGGWWMGGVVVVMEKGGVGISRCGFGGRSARRAGPGSSSHGYQRVISFTYLGRLNEELRLQNSNLGLPLGSHQQQRISRRRGPTFLKTVLVWFGSIRRNCLCQTSCKISVMIF